MFVTDDGKLIFDDPAENAMATALDQLNDSNVLAITLLGNEYLAGFWRDLQKARNLCDLITRGAELRKQAASRLTDEERAALKIDENGNGLPEVCVDEDCYENDEYDALMGVGFFGDHHPRRYKYIKNQ